MNRSAGRLIPGFLLLSLVVVGGLVGCARQVEPSASADVVTRALVVARESGGPLVLSALLFLLPGGVVVAWLWREGTWLERLGLAGGLSVAVNALLIYATLSGLRLNAVVVVGFLVLCGAGIVVRWGLDLRDWVGQGGGVGALLALVRKAVGGDRERLRAWGQIAIAIAVDPDPDPETSDGGRNSGRVRRQDAASATSVRDSGRGRWRERDAG